MLQMFFELSEGSVLYHELTGRGLVGRIFRLRDGGDNHSNPAMPSLLFCGSRSCVQGSVFPVQADLQPAIQFVRGLEEFTILQWQGPVLHTFAGGQLLATTTTRRPSRGWPWSSCRQPRRTTMRTSSSGTARHWSC